MSKFAIAVFPVPVRCIIPSSPQYLFTLPTLALNIPGFIKGYSVEFLYVSSGAFFKTGIHITSHYHTVQHIPLFDEETGGRDRNSLYPVDCGGLKLQ